MRLLLGIVILGAALVSASCVSYVALSRLLRHASAVGDAQDGLDAIADLSAAVDNAEAAHEAYLFTGDQRYLDDHSGVQLNQRFEHVRELLADSSAQQVRLKRLRETILAQRGALTRMGGVRKGTLTEPARQIELTDRWLAARAATNTVIREMQDEEHEQLLQHQEAQRTCHEVALSAVGLTALLGLIAVAGLLRLLRRHRAVSVEAAAAVHRQCDLVDAFLDRTTDAVIASDPEGIITRLNAAAESLTGWKQADAVGRHIDAVFRIIDQETRKPCGNPALDALRWGRVVVPERGSLLVSANDSEQPIEQTAAPLRHENGKVSGALLVFRSRR